jgi:hypothetical protein
MVELSDLAFDLDAARRHLELIAGEADPVVAWQIFDDTKTDKSLARGFHGRLGDVLPRLTAAQRKGCGVYIAVNKTDGRGRRKENMQEARALFLDLDGAPLPESWPVKPDLTVHSSSHNGVDKYQCWWLIEATEDWDRWQRMQLALADRYDGDRKCALVTQVGRCAGFWHLKVPDQPWQVKIVSDAAIDETTRWSLDGLVEKFGFDLSAVKLPASRATIDRPPPMHGWDNDLDILAAQSLVADEANWVLTSDGAFSIFKMACRLRDLGVSEAMAIELIEEHVPALPTNAEGDNRYVEKKVANAFRYARNAAGVESIEADRRDLVASLDELHLPDADDGDHDSSEGSVNEIVRPVNGNDPYAHLFHTAASERPELSDPKNLALIARLKLEDPRRYEELIVKLKLNKVPRLAELERDVNSLLKQSKKNAAARRTPADEDDRFERGERGQILPTQENIRLAIEKLGITLRYDAFAGTPTIAGLPEFGPALDDHAMNRMWLLVDERFKFTPPLTFFQIVVADACQRNPFHPVRDYLDSLEWDGVERLDNWLVRYCGVDDTPYARAVGRLMLIAAVRRVRQPGSKHDEMLVLEGPEGLSKSTLLETLAVHDDWFSDSLPLNADDKKMIESASGKWIIEVSELQGMRKGDVGKIKAQVSRKRDRARLAYGRLPVEVDRQCVFFGSVNPIEAEGYLASITGNRRFWPIAVKKVDLEAFRRDRDQLWAEASAREALGDTSRLDPSLWPEAVQQQTAREAPNPFRDALAPHIAHRQGTLFSEDVWIILNVPVDRRQAIYGKVGKAMRDLGWSRVKRRRRHGADQEWAYVRGDEASTLQVLRGFQGDLIIRSTSATSGYQDDGGESETTDGF